MSRLDVTQSDEAWHLFLMFILHCMSMFILTYGDGAGNTVEEN